MMWYLKSLVYGLWSIVRQFSKKGGVDLPSSAICFVFDLYGVGKKKVVRAPLLLHHSNH